MVPNSPPEPEKLLSDFDISQMIFIICSIFGTSSHFKKGSHKRNSQYELGLFFEHWTTSTQVVLRAYNFEFCPQKYVVWLNSRKNLSLIRSGFQVAVWSALNHKPVQAKDNLIEIGIMHKKLAR